MAASSLQPGVLLQGAYVLEEELGDANGKVYPARRQRDGALVIVRLFPTLAPPLAAAVLEQAQLASRVRHPALASVEAFGRTDEGCFIVSEYVHGQRLDDWADEIGIPPLGQVIELVRRLCLGLQTAARSGMAHDGINPRNILVPKQTQSPRLPVRLLDLGVPAFVRARPHTQALRFMSPEQLQALATPERGAMFRCNGTMNVYSCGCLLYYLATGGPPYAGSTVEELRASQAAGRLALPLRINPQISPALNTLIVRALALDPATRFPSVGELADALTSAAGSLQPHVGVAPRPGAPAVPAQPLERREAAVSIEPGAPAAPDQEDPPTFKTARPPELRNDAPTTTTTTGVRDVPKVVASPAADPTLRSGSVPPERREARATDNRSVSGAVVPERREARATDNRSVSGAVVPERRATDDPRNDALGAVVPDPTLRGGTLRGSTGPTLRGPVTEPTPRGSTPPIEPSGPGQAMDPTVRSSLASRTGRSTRPPVPRAPSITPAGGIAIDPASQVVTPPSGSSTYPPPQYIAPTPPSATSLPAEPHSAPIGLFSSAPPFQERRASTAPPPTERNAPLALFSEPPPPPPQPPIRAPATIIVAEAEPVESRLVGPYGLTAAERARYRQSRGLGRLWWPLAALACAGSYFVIRMLSPTPPPMAANVPAANSGEAQPTPAAVSAPAPVAAAPSRPTLPAPVSADRPPQDPTGEHPLQTGVAPPAPQVVPLDRQRELRDHAPHSRSAPPRPVVPAPAPIPAPRTTPAPASAPTVESSRPEPAATPVEVPAFIPEPEETASEAPPPAPHGRPVVTLTPEKSATGEPAAAKQSKSGKAREDVAAESSSSSTAPSPLPLAAKAEFEGIVVRGSLPTSLVRRALDRIRPQLNACYARAAQTAGHNGFGELEVEVQIDERGRARNAHSRGAKLPQLDACVAEATSKLVSEKAPDTGTVSASWKVAFRP